MGAAGLLQRFGLVELPASLAVLAHPLVLGLSLTLFLIEFIADKVPVIDSAWDAVHTFIRPPAAAVLAFGAMGGLDESWRIAAALLAGSVALTSHGVKASTRAAVNTSPEPVSNWILSFTEDGIALFLVWMATHHPVITIALVVALLVIGVLLLRAFFGALKRMIGRLKHMNGRTATRGPGPTETG